MSIVIFVGIVLVRKANDAMDGLRAEMSGRRTSEHQGHVGELDVRPSGDTDLQRCRPLGLKGRRISIAGDERGSAVHAETRRGGRAICRTAARPVGDRSVGQVMWWVWAPRMTGLLGSEFENQSQ